MAGSSKRTEAGTSSRILDIAERLVQSRGFNGFSYADIAAELHISKASLHYHFPGKAELGEALIARYASRFGAALQAIDGTAASAPAKLAAYAELYADVVRGNGMCLCGMLAAEYRTLPGPMRDAVVGFFDENEVWLAAVLEQGREQGTLQFPGTSRATARMIVSSLEGAMLVARPYADPARFEAGVHHLLESLAGSADAVS
jgi:TetR/AcrR family transcriptional repressor of nem operon